MSFNFNAHENKLTDAIKCILAKIGLSDFEVVFQRLAIKPSFLISLNYCSEFDERLLDENTMIKNVLETIRDNVYQQVLNSPIVKDKDEKIETLTAEVERLKQFETYYNMEYELNFGKEKK